MKQLAVLLLAAAVCEAAAPFSGGPAIDNAIQEAIQAGRIPGAVVLIGHPGQVLYRKAYGSRALEPKREEMTEDTIFDAASLTKVVATTACIMKLFEEGKLRLSDPVTAYLPEFQGGQSGITVRHLLTHFSGLRPDLDLKPEWSGYETGIRKALVDKPQFPPGTHFTYSDINFELLGEIVHRLSGKTLADYARDEIFKPLGMKDSRFQPPVSDYGRIAPTEVLPGMPGPIRAVVHDPTARMMGGIAGHAGLFTTAGDLARYAEMMLGLGTREGVRIVSPLTVRKFTTPQTPPNQPVIRGLGWDIDSPFSGNRGELFPLGSYGHTGFTGTSLWIDPATQTYVILLTNAVHPHIGKPITPLRAKVATIAAAAVGIDAPRSILTSNSETLSGPRVVARNGQVRTGLDVAAEKRFPELQGKRVGLITNHTGEAYDRRRNIDVLIQAGVKLTALFSPEHGIAGKEDHENIGNTKDAASGVPVYSLYSGPNRRPTPEMLAKVDVLAFDIQDVGTRFYTYTCTMLNAMEEAAKAKKPFYVFDRPNPVTGTHVEGPLLDKDLESFIGCHSLPLRHGMTLGELAQLFNAERQMGVELHVLPMRGWVRGDWFDNTGLHWVNPSPNMRSLPAAILYPGLGMLEYSRNYSVGRGTDAPFEQIGADWINGRALAEYLNGRGVPGVRVYATHFTPSASNLAGKTCEGVRFVLTDREAFDSTRLGLEVAAALTKLYPGKFDLAVNMKLIGNRQTVAELQAGDDPRLIQQRWHDALESFAAVRARYLLY